MNPANGAFVCVQSLDSMNFYFEAANVLDRIDNKRGSIKGILGSLPEKDRRRTSALVIETLKCTTSPISRISLTC